MLDENEFQTIRDAFEEEDKTREHVIKRSRDVLKAAKHAVYSLHRSDADAAKAQLSEAEAAAKAILPLLETHPRLRQGAFSSALEEYAEAKALFVFLSEGRLVTLGELEFLEPEEYLLGLCDFTGELGRHAVHAATERKRDTVKRTRDMIDAVFGQLLQFDFRNSELRRKYDSVKYNLKKVEDVLYELSLKTLK